MAVPPKVPTLAERVKKLEQDFRRIKISPSVIQSAVQPSAAKGSLWLDSSAGNEPKVFDGTTWVPARDQTIAAAQSTADTAQATVAPLVPLTDLAGVTTGLTMTGATNVTTDPGTGAHVVVNDPAYPGQIALYSGNTSEVDPGRIMPVLGGANYGKLEIRSPDLVGGGAGYSYLELDGFDDGTKTAVLHAGTSARLESDAADVWGYDKVRIGDSSTWFEVVGNAVTLADLSSLTNVFPTFPYYYAYLNANQSIATSGAAAKVTGWVADGSPNSSGITFSAGNFTVPTTGRYRLRAQAWWAAVASPVGVRTVQWVRVTPNTTLISSTVPGNATVATPVRAEKTVQLTAGDQIFVQVIQGQASPFNLTGSNPDITYAQIEWVGP